MVRTYTLCMLSVHAYVITWRASDPSEHRKRPLHNELYLDPDMRAMRLLQGMGREGHERERQKQRRE